MFGPPSHVLAPRAQLPTKSKQWLLKNWGNIYTEFNLLFLSVCEFPKKIMSNHCGSCWKARYSFWGFKIPTIQFQRVSWKGVFLQSHEFPEKEETLKFPGIFSFLDLSQIITAWQPAKTLGIIPLFLSNDEFKARELLFLTLNSLVNLFKLVLVGYISLVDG